MERNAEGVEGVEGKEMSDTKKSIVFRDVNISLPRDPEDARGASQNYTVGVDMAQGDSFSITRTICTACNWEWDSVTDNCLNIDCPNHK